MKRAVSVALVILVMSLLVPVACGKAANSAPTAYIDSITPGTATPGQAVTFNGHGTDSDGTVVAYSWNSSIDGAIGTTAYFTTSSLSVGTHTISLRVQDNNGDWSGAITAQLVVQEGQEGSDMEGAVDVVVEDVLPDIPEIQDGSPYMCLKLDSILSAGTVIEEDSGHTLKLTLQEDSYFFYLDLAPGALYEHPVRYILVDKSGNHSEYEAKWWPRIGGSVPENLLQSIPDDDSVVAANVELVEPSSELLAFAFPSSIPQCQGFIAVEGLTSMQPNYMFAVQDYQNMMAFFNSYANNNSCCEVTGLAGSQSAGLLDEIDTMAQAHLNPITISIVANGYGGAAQLGMSFVSAQTLKNKVAAYPNTSFNFIITTSGSGVFIDTLKTLDNVCVVSTACDNTETAYRDYDSYYFKEDPDTMYGDYNPQDRGFEWTSSILQAMNQIAGDSTMYNSVVSLARQYDVSPMCVLICEGHWGGLGGNPDYGLSHDLDIACRAGLESPQLYCSWE